MTRYYASKTNVVVTCWNALEHTRATLESLFATVHHYYFLTIVDNGSSDDTADYLSALAVPSWCEKLTLISNPDNKGAGAAINQGQEVSDRYGLEYTCLCNNDLYFSDNWLIQLENCLDAHPDFGILGILRPAVDTKHHTKPASAKSVVDGTPRGYSISQELDYFSDGYQFEEAAKMIVAKNGGGVDVLRCPPNAVVTCCALVRNKTSEHIGQFSDPRFETYGSEDIDLSWRIQKAGFKCTILKDVYVHHFRHRSISASHLDREKFLLENNKKFAAKWKQDIFAFLKAERQRGVDVAEKMGTEKDPEYFFLRRIQDKAGFMAEYTTQ